MNHVLSHTKEENFKAESTYVTDDSLEGTLTGNDLFENRQSIP
jgi:hypothetical protein